VINGVSEFYISVEAENGHKSRASWRQSDSQMRPCNGPDAAIMNCQFTIINLVENQGLDTPADGNYIRMFSH